MERYFVMDLIVSFAALGCGGPPAELTLEQRSAVTLAALRDDREAFEAAARGDDSDDVMRRLRQRGVLTVRKEGPCTVFMWPFTHAFDAIPIIYFAPARRLDLPDRFWESPSTYCDPMEVDSQWFVAQKP